MHIISGNRNKQKALFVVGIAAVYFTMVVWLDFLQGPLWGDEVRFWPTVVEFSENFPPGLGDLRNYNQLNTPLPFIIFGALEHFFSQGVAAGRLFNLALSLVIAFVIGWPSRYKGGRALLCLFGLFVCPYFLWLSMRLLTELIACFFVLFGLWCYVRDRYVASIVMFVLAIAARQYMVAFPAAIATYEFFISFHKLRTNGLVWSEQKRWIVPAIAAASLLGWFAFFGGLAPSEAVAEKAPKVQQSLLALQPGGFVNFLSFTGLYIVIPEFLLFQPRQQLQALSRDWRRIVLSTLGLLFYVSVFPPLLMNHGLIFKVARLLPSDFLQIALFYILALPACIRFSRSDLISFMVFFNCAIGLKAIPWDKYILPMAVAFWYLKSIRWEGSQVYEAAEASDTKATV